MCLNMIVRDEAHIVGETINAVAPFIDSWVVVDTGSVDGTQDLIRRHMADLGIPGEMHERPWRNFGVNRSEALDLAQGHADYIWVLDADDLLIGSPELTGLDAGAYDVRLTQNDVVYWRKQIFRDGLRWRYEGVLHEYPVCEDAYTEKRLAGEYFIESRRLGARSRDPLKYARDAELLLAEVTRNPEDARSVFYLAQSYYDAGDFESARRWYSKRADMGGWDEEVYCAMLRVGESLEELGAPWPDVHETYLRAWEFRPSRAEPLYAIARHYRVDQRFATGHLYAERAAAIEQPADTLFVRADVYSWRALDEQAVCASRIGRHHEALTLCRRLIAMPDIPDEHRQRIAANRDFSVPALLEAAAKYPISLAHRVLPESGNTTVTVSLVTGSDRALAERTLNSFLTCCLDLQRVSRVLAVDTGLSPDDRAWLLERYPFLEFCGPLPADQPTDAFELVRNIVQGRLWLNLACGWTFFAPEHYLTRLTGVLESEPDVVQVGVNIDDAQELNGLCAAEGQVRRAPGAGRYVLSHLPLTGPAMFECGRLDRLLHTESRLQTATFDEVLCVLGT